MSRTVLILRPQPGADRSAARARALGLKAVIAPLFEVRPLDWEPPEPARFDAVLLTSANAARQGGGGLKLLTALPCYAVGDATAEAAAEAGFGRIFTGPSDGAAAAAMMADAGVRRALHLCGREHVKIENDIVDLDHVPVYASEAVADLPPAAAQALTGGTVALVHSPRAAVRLAELVGDRRQVRLAAISRAAADAAGEGWAVKAVASAPRDEALLELAARLCHYGGSEAEDRGEHAI